MIAHLIWRNQGIEQLSKASVGERWLASVLCVRGEANRPHHVTVQAANSAAVRVGAAKAADVEGKGRPHTPSSPVRWRWRQAPQRAQREVDFIRRHGDRRHDGILDENACPTALEFGPKDR
jgi:hypothetical protein